MYRLLVGSIRVETCETHGDGSTINVGDLEVGAAFTVAGKVVLSDKQPIPYGTRLLISRDEAWDTQTVMLNDDGTFLVEGVPEEVVNVSVRIPGYRISDRNVSFEKLNRLTLQGVVNRNIDNLLILLEPGHARIADFRSMSREEQKQLHRDLTALKTKPLQGVSEALLK